MLRQPSIRRLRRRHPHRRPSTAAITITAPPAFAKAAIIELSWAGKGVKALYLAEMSTTGCSSAGVT